MEGSDERDGLCATYQVFLAANLAQVTKVVLKHYLSVADPYLVRIGVPECIASSPGRAPDPALYPTTGGPSLGVGSPLPGDFQPHFIIVQLPGL